MPDTIRNATSITLGEEPQATTGGELVRVTAPPLGPEAQALIRALKRKDFTAGRLTVEDYKGGILLVKAKGAEAVLELHALVELDHMAQYTANQAARDAAEAEAAKKCFP